MTDGIFVQAQPQCGALVQFLGLLISVRRNGTLFTEVMGLLPEILF